MSAVPAFLEGRRSIRAFRPDPVDPAELDALVNAAGLAPAPHHTRPWRFAVLTDRAARQALATGMGEAWRRDLERDGLMAERIDALVEASHRRLAAAPAAILGCLTDEGLDRYPDATRQRAEWGMAVLSLGAAVENLMLAAADAGLASCWVAAPIFCPDAARVALGLDESWVPQALILVGYPDPGYRARPRLPVDVEELRVRR